ncbi:MAG: hypothetical protein IJ275_04780 [Ruminococcus sp.]|nr:hypothetical protein [Ruminococcus sp.]
MENNERDFMKNRPVAANANQAKDVYGSMKKGSVNLITLLLTIVLLVCTISNFVSGRIMWGIIFTFLLIVLLLSQYVSHKSSKVNSKPDKCEHPDAIFKDHEE